MAVPSEDEGERLAAPGGGHERAVRRVPDHPGGARFVALATLALSVALIYWAKDVLLPFALAILLSFLLTPLVARFERLRLGRIPSVILAVGLAFAVIAGAGWLVSRQAVELSDRLPEYKDNLIARVRSVGSAKGKLKEASEAIEEISNELAADAEEETEEAQVPEEPEVLKAAAVQVPTVHAPVGSVEAVRNAVPLEEPSVRSRGTRRGGGSRADEETEIALPVKIVALPPSPIRQIQDWLGPLVSPLVTFAMVVVIVIFTLIHRRDLRNRLLLLFGRTNLRITTEALNDAAQRVSRYLRTQLLINSCYGAAVGIGLYVIGIPNAFLWGVLGLLLRFLPYVGPWLAAAMPLALSLAVFEDWNRPLMTAGWFVVLELIVNNVLEPWLYGSSTGVSPMGIIVSAVFWTWIWGSVGLVLAVPLTVCLIVAARYVPQLRFLAILFSDQTELPLHSRIYQRLLAEDEDEAEALSRDFLKSGALAALYDTALIPALRLAEEDRHAGQLRPSQESFIMQAVRELAEELEPAPSEELGAGERSAESEAGGAPSERRPRGRVLCLPVRDEADEVAMLMLARLLRERGFEVQEGGTATLAGELLDTAKSQPPDAIVLSIVPPLGGRDGRYLCKRVRSVYPHLPLLVGLWDGDGMDKTLKRLTAAGASYVVTSLEEAVRRLDSLGPRFRDQQPHAANHSPASNHNRPEPQHAT